MTARLLIDNLLPKLEDKTPPKAAFDDPEAETDFYVRQPFTAWDHAQRHGHHPKLWKVIKGSPYERLYRQKFKVSEATVHSATLARTAP
jgi:hypothetical protein